MLTTRGSCLQFTPPQSFIDIEIALKQKVQSLLIIVDAIVDRGLLLRASERLNILEETDG